jgi:hypothetical protein
MSIAFLACGPVPPCPEPPHKSRWGRKPPAVDRPDVRGYKGPSYGFCFREGKMSKFGPKVSPLANEWVFSEAEATLESEGPRPSADGHPPQRSETQLAGWRFRVTEVSGPELVRSRLPFTFEDVEGERAAEFRRRFELEEVISRGRTELEGLMLLRDWVADQVPFGQPPKDADIDPFHILERAAQGAKHNCTYLSVVYLAALVSLGHVARKLSTLGHGTVEVWSNELAKWVVLDPSRRNCYSLGGTLGVSWPANEAGSPSEGFDRGHRRQQAEGDGVPLNAQEVREQHFADGGVSMEVVYGLGERRERVTLQKREDGHLKYRQEAFGWTAYHDRNNFLTKLVDFGRDRFYILRDRHNRGQTWTTQPSKPEEKPGVDPRYKLATLTERLADIYWSANVSRLHLALRSPRSLTVQLETVTPNFGAFLVEKDGDWKRTRAEFTWRLREGRNRLVVRSRNRAGVVGPVASVVVEAQRSPAE